MKLLCGDVLVRTRKLATESVHCVVTSPPYWGLRDYGTGKWKGGSKACDHKQLTRHQAQGASSQRIGRTNADARRNETFKCNKCGARRIDQQIGLERTPEEYVVKLTTIFREVRRVLRKDGTLWLNVGDSYAGGAKQDAAARPGSGRADGRVDARAQRNRNGNTCPPNCKPKDLVGIPWMLALALRADGWYLRQDIIWAKPNAMPESMKDRCTKSYEHLFLLAKAPHYYFDHEALKEPCVKGYAGSSFNKGKTAEHELGRASEKVRVDAATRSKRDVWTIGTQPCKEAHFAAFPERLVESCLLAGCPELPGGAVVLDPFCGSGTVGMVCKRFHLDFIGIDLNKEYLQMARRRIGAHNGN